MHRYRASRRGRPDFTVELRDLDPETLTRTVDVAIIRPGDKKTGLSASYVTFDLVVDREGNVQGMDKAEGLCFTYYPPGENGLCYVLSFSPVAQSTEAELTSVAKTVETDHGSKYKGTFVSGTEEFNDFLRHNDLPQAVDWIQTLQMYMEGEHAGTEVTAQSIWNHPLIAAEEVPAAS